MKRARTEVLAARTPEWVNGSGYVRVVASWLQFLNLADHCAFWKTCKSARDIPRKIQWPHDPRVCRYEAYPYAQDSFFTFPRSCPAQKFRDVAGCYSAVEYKQVPASDPATVASDVYAWRETLVSASLSSMNLAVTLRDLPHLRKLTVPGKCGFSDAYIGTGGYEALYTHGRALTDLDVAVEDGQAFGEWLLPVLKQLVFLKVCFYVEGKAGSFSMPPMQHLQKLDMRLDQNAQPSARLTLDAVPSLTHLAVSCYRSDYSKATEIFDRGVAGQLVSLRLNMKGGGPVTWDQTTGKSRKFPKLVDLWLGIADLPFAELSFPALQSGYILKGCGATANDLDAIAKWREGLVVKRVSTDSVAAPAAGEPTCLVNCLDTCNNCDKLLKDCACDRCDDCEQADCVCEPCDVCGCPKGAPAMCDVTCDACTHDKACDICGLTDCECSD